MRVLLDECLPGRKLKPTFPDHDVWTVADMGCRGVTNGELLAKAEPEVDAFVTVDGALQYPRDTPGVGLLIVVLRARSNRLEHLLALASGANAALRRGGSREVAVVGAWCRTDTMGPRLPRDRQRRGRLGRLGGHADDVRPGRPPARAE